MLNIKLNEQPFETMAETLFALRDAVKPEADIVILNGAAMSADAPLAPAAATPRSVPTSAIASTTAQPNP